MLINQSINQSILYYREFTEKNDSRHKWARNKAYHTGKMYG